MEHFVWNANPILLEIGPIQLYWYGLLFVGSFVVGLYILTWIYKREGRDPEVLESLFVYIIAGAAIGARLVHCFFYEPSFFFANPLKILAIWEGGLASHGGVIGVLIAVWLFAKHHKESYFWLLSRVAIPAALSATAIRIGNFMNSEIVGIPSDVPWAIVFQRLDELPRHPVQLYESLTYMSVFILLLFVYRVVKPSFATKILPALFFLTIFTARFFLEFVKTKQAHYTTDLAFSTGQMLSIPFIALGLAWFIWAFVTEKKE
ncbi:prolipoprotein diacylglyceryl transferase [Sulfurovum sp. bin170]|uniref:prolipoprotein diacylglyceryl transferase n=1 Tax=Sulfurovum sp. bin170 TaxID=2695268 RepID=UPI0013DF6355|nr:prolipoprotein diacylglyceryl transferase [Sulfurovum sp. bin170]NEW60888.1 prolipoprotein diacylglyceryl transferase [Sulfurovum sp. bin170]